MLSLDSNFNAKMEWHKTEYNIHWMTPIVMMVTCMALPGGTKEVLKFFAPAWTMAKRFGETVCMADQTNGSRGPLRTF